jgi:hypothetical protein
MTENLQKYLYFYVEGETEKRFIEPLCKRLFPAWMAEVFSLGNKSNVINQSPSFIKNLDKQYGLKRHIILFDQDTGNCEEEKKLLALKIKAVAPLAAVEIRIACNEIESWFLGDINTLKEFFNLPNINNSQEKYRHTDEISKPSTLLTRETKGAYQKSGIEVSRIAEKINIEENKSISFHYFIKAINRLTQEVTL